MRKKDSVILAQRPCYTLVARGEDMELTMYGEVVEKRPTDWMTGQPDAGEYIVLQEFLSDIEQAKDAASLTIRMNSLGGDAYAAIAIHNRLKEIGAKKTCIVDGAAMSGGSLIMCACDAVKVNPSSMIMIHNCSAMVMSRVTAEQLTQMADNLAKLDACQAKIYAEKTGKSEADIRQMMAATTYMTGQEAIDAGFADELMENAKPAEISASADHMTLYVNGHSLRIAAMGELPETIPTIVPAPAGSSDTISPDASGKKGSVFMTLEDFRKENPEAAEALLAEAKATFSTDEAVQAERQRLSEIDALAHLFDPQTVQAAKYDSPCTAQEMCYRAAQESVKQGKAYMAAVKADYRDSGADGVEAVHAEADEEVKPMTQDDLVAAGRAAALKILGKKEEV